MPFLVVDESTLPNARAGGARRSHCCPLPSCDVERVPDSCPCTNETAVHNTVAQDSTNPVVYPVSVDRRRGYA
ncbi:hypothetical protein HMPREF3227_01904 [Corynebacterium sp. CMW7794]|nr:hypothetical protein HMPREF3227_01904 [Corynebacterium sp. CMW7794]